MSRKSKDTYVILEQAEIDLLKKKQEYREQHGLPYLNIQRLAKLYMLEGMFQRHFLETKGEAH